MCVGHVTAEGGKMLCPAAEAYLGTSADGALAVGAMFRASPCVVQGMKGAKEERGEDMYVCVCVCVC